MKKCILIIFVVASIIACKDNPVTKKIKETKKTVTNTKNAVNEMKNIQEDMTKLQEETPLTNDELKAWLPDEIDGMKRISYKAGHMSMLQLSSIEATYANEDKSKKIKIEVIDGAGPTGSASITGFKMMFSQDFEEESETKIHRSAKRDGKKVIEEFRKNRNNSNIQYMENDRFFIKGHGTNMDLDETWDAIKKFKTEDLDS